MHSILIIYDTYLHKSGSSSGFDLEVLLTSKKARSKQMQYQSLTRVTSSTKKLAGTVTLASGKCKT